MTYRLSTKSKNRLLGVHPDLVNCVMLAIQYTDQDFLVLEGVRSKRRQQRLVAEGKSKTMHSRHLTGHAVDLAPYPISWDWDKFYPIADAMIRASKGSPGVAFGSTLLTGASPMLNQFSSYKSRLSQSRGY